MIVSKLKSLLKRCLNILRTGTAKKAFRYIGELISDNKLILFFILVSCLGLAALTFFILKPAYTNTTSKLYTSKLGHPNILRKSGKPLPIYVTKPEIKKFTINVMGEGVCSSRPILVPVIPMAPITGVMVEEGDHVKKGDLLATLNNAKSLIKRDSAKYALSTAEAELKRVQLGSAYVLAQERPEVEKINLAALEEQTNYAKETLEKFETAFDRGVISKVKLLESRSAYSKVFEELEKAYLAMEMAEKGVLESLKIAENSVNDARQALAHREEELKEFFVYSPVDGIVDQVLINPGEYNQDSGKPGFLISSGLWFDAFFDQSDFSLIKRGTAASVSLESQPGQVFPTQISAIKPVVSFNSGGPEISRPLRPRGSGSPEWAATFKAKLSFSMKERSDDIVTGMTGFARVAISRESITVPRSAVLSISAGSAILHVVNSDDTWEIRPVKVGFVSDEFAEILEGVTLDEEVMIDGHWTLQLEDKIEVIR